MKGDPSFGIFSTILVFRKNIPKYTKMSKPHRGRLQAQGKDLEKSVSWAQDEPLSKEDALNLLDKLKKLLTPKELKERERQIQQAKRYIENVNGGVDAIKKKAFVNVKEKTRIDIEILGGTAFVTVLLLAVLLWYLYA